MVARGRTSRLVIFSVSTVCNMSLACETVSIRTRVTCMRLVQHTTGIRVVCVREPRGIAVGRWPI